MKKVALGLVLLGVIGFGALAVNQSYNMFVVSKGRSLPKVAQDVSVHGKNKDFKLSDIKFLDSKIIERNGNEIISTKIKNDSDRAIAGIEYTYEIGGQVVILETSEKLTTGAVSNLIETPVKKDVNLKDSDLLKVSISFVDAKNEISNLEFVKSA